MSTATSIEWTDRTWNPVRGCSLVSDGCRSCYAMKQAHRFSGQGKPYEGLTELGPKGPRWTGKIRTVEDALDEPLRWRRPRKVFVNSMSDLFHEDVPDAFIDRVFAVMALAPQQTFQVLTKRAERMWAYMSDSTLARRVMALANSWGPANGFGQHGDDPAFVASPTSGSDRCSSSLIWAGSPGSVTSRRLALSTSGIGSRAKWRRARRRRHG
jgi:protein gp37